MAEFVEEYNNANKGKERVDNKKLPTKWEPPNAGTTKINIDAGCFDNETTGWGMLARNYEGTVSFAVTKFEKIKSSPTLAEALGLRWCLQWAKEQNLSNVVIEFVAELVVKCLYGKLKLSVIEPVILDC